MKLCIPVCVSFECNIPKELQQDPYVLVGCGGYRSDKMKFTDDVSDNISQWNQYVNDYSLTYWIAKNYEKIGNPDYIGIAQYRRILTYENWMLQPNSIVCSMENYKMPIYKNYCCCHIKDDIDFVIKMMQEKFPDMMNRFIEFCQQTQNFGRNLFIMHKDKFAQYSQFICSIIKTLINELFPSSNIAQRDKYQRRALAFLLERLTGFWIYDQMAAKQSTLVITHIHTFNISSPYQRI